MLFFIYSAVRALVGEIGIYVVLFLSHFNILLNFLPSTLGLSHSSNIAWENHSRNLEPKQMYSSLV